MLLSRDGTKAFVAVPKTGTNSVRYILKQFTGALEAYPLNEGDEFQFFIANYHTTVESNLNNIRTKFPNATVESITAYAFLRDPVERWCSAVNFHYKRQPWYLMGLKSVASNPRKLRILNETVSDRLHEDQFMNPSYGPNKEFVFNPVGLKLVKEFFSPEVVAEMAQTPWEDFPINLDESPFFYPQAHWLTQPNTVILDYSKFDEELAWLVNQEWGGSKYYSESNSSYKNKSEVKKLPVSDSLRKRLMDAYSMDYDLTPHTIS